VQFTSISVPIFSKCDANGDPENDAKTVNVILGTEATELLKFQQIADIQGIAACSQDVAACPDGWLIRPEWHRSQVIYQFAEIDKSGNITGAPKYRITVPHHLPTKATTGLPNYKRGNWEIIFVLGDNSKVTIHAFDEANGMTVLAEIKKRILPAYVDTGYLSKSSLIVFRNPLTDGIDEITVKNRMAKYYATGAKSSLPDWIAKW
jgi:hypothetical protein